MAESDVCKVITHGQCDECDHPCFGYFEIEFPEDEEFEDDSENFDDNNTCCCPYCMCGLPVSAPGATCSDCLSGAHQG